MEKPKLPSRRQQRMAKFKSEQATSFNSDIEPGVAAMVVARQKEQQAIHKARIEHDLRIEQELQLLEKMKNEPRPGKAHKKK